MLRTKVSPDLLFIITVSSAVIPGIMSTAMLSLAFSDIAHYFNVSYQAFQWRNVIFFGLFSISILYFGSTVQTIGARKLILVAQSIFVISATISSCTSNWYIFIAVQGFQAVADGMMVPSQMSLIRNRINEERWGWAFGWFHGTLAVAPLTGPILGAFLINKYSWQAMPLLVGALQFVILVGCLRLLPHDQISARSFPSPPVISAIVLFSTLCLGQFALERTDDTIGIYRILPAIGIVLSMAAFMLFERFLLSKNRISLVPWTSLKQQRFVLALFRIFCVFLVSNALSLHLPSALISTSNITLNTIGLILTAAALMNILLEPFLGRFSDRWSYSSLNIGLALMLCATSLYLIIPDAKASVIFISATILTVFAAALFSPAQLRNASLSISTDDRDRFMGFYMFCQFVSGAFAAAIFGEVLQDPETKSITIASFHRYALLCVGLLGLAFLSGLVSAFVEKIRINATIPADGADKDNASSGN